MNFDPLRLHRQAIVIDGHADTPQRFCDDAWSLTGDVGSGHLSVATACDGGLSAQFFVAWAEPAEWAGRFAERTEAQIDAVHRQVEMSPDALALARTPDDIRLANQTGKLAALLSVEGAHSLEGSLDRLRNVHARGVRYLTLTWSNSNEFADSSGDAGQHGGLSTRGHDLVREMNRLGMMIDVSHAADTTFWDVLRTTRVPVIASHSSARALCDSPRNLTDDMLRAIATSNGIAMVNFYPAFLDDRFREAWSATAKVRAKLHVAAAAPFRAAGKAVPYSVSMEVDSAFYRDHLADTVPLPTLDTLVDHIEHVAEVAGINHVGLGSDFDGIPFLPQGMTSAADLPKLTQALAERGFTAEQLVKLLGGNLLRVFTDVQAAASL